MRAPWWGTGFLGAPALALLLCLAGSPGYAEDALLAPRLGAAAPAGNLPGNAMPGVMAMSPAHGVPFAEPAPEAQAEPRDGAAPAPSEAKPEPPDGGTAPGESGQVSAPALPPV